MPQPFLAIAACVIFLGAYVLIATEKWVGRAAAALGGAALILALGITDAHGAFYSEESGVDWNVVFLLLGMMVIVSVMRETGIFEYLAIWAAKRARGETVPVDGAADHHHRGRVGAAGQRHHRAAGRPGDDPAVPAPGAAGGPVPARRGVRVQRRGHRHPGRRSAEHHHRQPRRAVVQRLPDPPRPGRGRAGRTAHRAVPLAVRRRLPRRRGTGGRDHGPRRAGSDQGQAAARAVAGRARGGAGRVRPQPQLRLRPVGGGAARRRPAGRGDQREHRIRAAGRRVGDAGVLHGAVHHGRRSGQRRRPGRHRRRDRRVRRRRPGGLHRCAARAAPGCCRGSWTTSPTSPP